MDNNCFVKIEYDLGAQDINGKHLETKINCSKENNLKISSNGSKYLIGGGVYNKNKGCFVFKAKNYEEAKEIAKNNSFLKYKTYKYKKLSVIMFT